jgi:hypothetical protein
VHADKKKITNIPAWFEVVILMTDVSCPTSVHLKFQAILKQFKPSPPLEEEI